MSTLQMPWQFQEIGILCGTCGQYLFIAIKNNFHYQHYCLNHNCKDCDIPKNIQKIMGRKVIVGIYITIIKKTRKVFQCGYCLEPILKGTVCINAFGYDYDDEKAYERIHIKSKCYEEWVREMSMLEIQKIKKMIDKVMKK